MSDPIPAARRITWQGNVGVPGGVPHRTTIYTTLSPSGGDDTAAVQTAINNCPTDQVVKLNDGSYTISARLSMKAHSVLRGSGAATIINANFVDFMVYFYGPFFAYDAVNFAAATSALKGDVTITLASIPSGGASLPRIGVGSTIMVQQANDAEVHAGYFGNSGTYAKGQWVVITGIAGNVVTFDPPLYSDYLTANSPRIRYHYAFADTPINDMQYSGLEDLTLRNANANCPSNIYMAFVSYCWVKNVKSENAGIAHLSTGNGFRCEVRDSYLNGVLAPLSSGRGYAIELGEFDTIGNRVSGWLFENNIFRGNRYDFGFGHGSSGCVLGYNLFEEPVFEDAVTQPFNIFVHSGHCLMNLVEGNICYGINPDIVFGSSEAFTFNRNWVRGKAPGRKNQLTCFEIDAYQRRHNVVGNVLGYPGILADIAALTSPAGTTIYSEEEPTAAAYNNVWKCYMLGYEGSGGGLGTSDGQVALTLLRKGNYNYADDAIPASEALGGDTLADSYYLPSKPAWFAYLAWPPVNPSSPGALSNDSIPAGFFYINGAYPQFDPIFTLDASVTGSSIEEATLTADPGKAIGAPDPTEDGQWFECSTP